MTTTKLSEHVAHELSRELDGYKQSQHSELCKHFFSYYAIFSKCIPRMGEVKSYHESVALSKVVLDKALARPEMEYWKNSKDPKDIEYYHKQVNAFYKRYETSCNAYAKRAIMEIYANELGYDRTQSKYCKKNYQILKSTEYKLGWHFMSGEKSARTYIKQLVTDIIKKEYAKLEGTFYKHYGNSDIDNIMLTHIRSGIKGMEASLRLMFSDKTTEHIVLEAIPAGGYNVQCFHYRYIIRVTSKRS